MVSLINNHDFIKIIHFGIRLHFLFDYILDHLNQSEESSWSANKPGQEQFLILKFQNVSNRFILNFVNVRLFG